MIQDLSTLINSPSSHVLLDSKINTIPQKELGTNSREVRNFSPNPSLKGEVPRAEKKPQA
jgi:hypothetical protein